MSSTADSATVCLLRKTLDELLVSGRLFAELRSELERIGTTEVDAVVFDAAWFDMLCDTLAPDGVQLRVDLESAKTPHGAFDPRAAGAALSVALQAYHNRQTRSFLEYASVCLRRECTTLDDVKVALDALQPPQF